MEVKWYGTASVSIEHEGTKILFDPFIRMNKKVKPLITVDDYKGADAIFTTHGHFDHIWSYPEIAKNDPAPFYATKTPVETLKKFGIEEKRLHTVKPGDKIQIGNMTVKVFQAKHVKIDLKYILSVIPLCVVLCPKIFYIEYLNKKCPENKENLGYEIECDGKRVFLMGSFGTVPYETYPTDCDMLVLPYGGCTRVPEITAPFIKNMMPKSILITHYDNSFPPATRRMDAEGLKDIVEKQYPGMKVYVPEEFKPYKV